MRKRWLAGIVLLGGLGAAYLGAQAYSSHRFEHELARTLATLQASQWQVSREAVTRGWFHSQGRVQLVHADNESWRVTLPYAARHGLLRTRLSGALQAHVRDAKSAAEEQMLFGDLLPSAEPRWTATFHALDRRSEGRLDVAPFTLERDGVRFSFTGAEFNLEGRAGDVELHGQVAPLHLKGHGETLLSGPLHVHGRYQVDDEGRGFHQRNELRLERLDYQGQQYPPITLAGLRYRDETWLDDQLRLDLSLSLEQASVSGESLLAGHLEARLERLDGDAVRRLWDTIEAQGGDLVGRDPVRRQALLERLEPLLLATLTDSPRLIVEDVTLASPMFGVDARGSGALTFDGSDIDTLSVTTLYRHGEFQAWRERLNGRFTWLGVPPLLNLQLGLPLHTRQYDIRIDEGVVRINDHPLPALF